jgi:hypothetical protein
MPVYQKADILHPIGFQMSSCYGSIIGDGLDVDSSAGHVETLMVLVIIRRGAAMHSSRIG